MVDYRERIAVITTGVRNNIRSALTNESRTKGRTGYA